MCLVAARTRGLAGTRRDMGHHLARALLCSAGTRTQTQTRTRSGCLSGYELILFIYLYFIVIIYFTSSPPPTAVRLPLSDRPRPRRQAVGLLRSSKCALFYFPFAGQPQQNICTSICSRVRYSHSHSPFTIHHSPFEFVFVVVYCGCV